MSNYLLWLRLILSSLLLGLSDVSLLLLLLNWSWELFEIVSHKICSVLFFYIHPLNQMIA